MTSHDKIIISDLTFMFSTRDLLNCGVSVPRDFDGSEKHVNALMLALAIEPFIRTYLEARECFNFGYHTDDYGNMIGETHLMESSEKCLSYVHNNMPQFASDCGRIVSYYISLYYEQKMKHEDAQRAEKNGGKLKKSISNRGYVYLIQSPTEAYKIGRAKKPKDRMKTFGVKLPFEVEYIALIKSDDYIQLEADLHHQFEDKRINGEWFALTPDDVEYIKGLANG